MQQALSIRKTIIEKYEPRLYFFETQQGIKIIKDVFERTLAKQLCLVRVTAPRFLKTGNGLQDDLAGTQIPVAFSIKTGHIVEMVQSLAKWKRFMLGKFKFEPGTGLYTDMDAVRKDEDIDATHSVYVDQWDWERVIKPEERTLSFLKSIVSKIYTAMLETESVVLKKFPKLKHMLPEKITFIHAEELEEIYPELSAKEREDRITEKHGAVFIIGIGYPLKSGSPHELRAADYDDWVTETGHHRRGLNGDILVWDDIRKKALELSSMGIRVDKDALLLQLDMMGLHERKTLEFHKGVLEGTIPLSIGGGIGQSRLCMFLLHKAHIAEVQSSVWPDEVEQEFEEKGIDML